MAQFKCPKCQTEVNDTMKYCPSCGQLLETEEVKKEPVKRGRPRKIVTIKCEDCGSEFDSKMDNCPNCGCPAPGKVSTKSLITCPECQNEIPDKSKECPICGYPLKEDVQDLKLENTSPVEVPKKAKKSNKPKDNSSIKQVTFYTLLALFFIAGCLTAVFLYSKVLDKKQDNKPETKTYKVTRTLSCVNENNSEERNYYFDSNTLIQYSMYTIKDYNTEIAADKEIKEFNKKWDNNSISADLYANREGTIVTKSLILDLKDSKDIELDDDIDSDDSYTNIKEKLENNNWQCQDHKSDLGTNLPINEIKKEA